MSFKAVNGDNPPVTPNAGTCEVTFGLVNLCDVPCIDVCLTEAELPPKCPVADFGHHSTEFGD
ncbi:hypothetical protein SAMN05446037_104810 [Anaerovirgula multivorans]|uniref:Uncharacterized protein n=1 Tax=Anaerovirgula multivorans TaxID=312168 RepID=A0A239KJD9_9FIRM|nr:hypothetical protein [Anaerovirgula multivorans]SNT17838.1 hypothetical protein SAMN05446037_104810 [Anaerovirgula multivorans]